MLRTVPGIHSKCPINGNLATIIFMIIIMLSFLCKYVEGVSSFLFFSFKKFVLFFEGYLRSSELFLFLFFLARLCVACRILVL